MRLWMTVGFGLALSGAACSRANPEFDGEDDASTSTSVLDGGNTLSDADGPATTTKPPIDDADGTSGAVDDAGTIGPVTSDTGVLETGGSEADTGVACAIPEDASVGIAVSSSVADTVEPDCETPLWTAVGPITISGSSITTEACGACKCGEPGGPITVAVSSEIGIPVFPACASLFVWGEVNGEGTCEWVGVAVIPDQATVPVWIAADTLSAPEALVGGFQIPIAPVDDCPAPQCDSAGLKALAFPEGDIAPDDAPMLVTVPFAAGVPLVVDNLMSYVDESCHDHFAFTAQDP